MSHSYYYSLDYMNYIYNSYLRGTLFIGFQYNHNNLIDSPVI